MMNIDFSYLSFTGIHGRETVHLSRYIHKATIDMVHSVLCDPDGLQHIKNMCGMYKVQTNMHAAYKSGKNYLRFLKALAFMEVKNIQKC